MLPVFVGAVLLAASLASVGSPRGNVAVSLSGNDDRLTRAYTQIRAGMRISQVAAFGFDINKAERLPKKALMARFMPTDSTKFDALDPAVKNCYRGSDDCTAYIFDDYTDQLLLLVQGGRVTWKLKFKSVVAGSSFSTSVG